MRIILIKERMKSMKRMVSRMLVVILLLASISSISVLAASYPSTSNYAYCEFTSPKNINVYRNSNLTTRGTSSPAKSYNAYIEKGDVCKIYTMNSSYIYLAYPTSSGYKNGYIRRSDLFSYSTPSEYVISKGQATTYKYAGSSSYGYVAKGDRVYKVGTSGNYILVIYDAKSGNRSYKIGYVSNNDYSNIIKGSTTQKNTTNSKGSVKLNVPLYKQTDSRWKNIYIGNKTIGQIGCTTTAIAMVYSYNSGTTVYPNNAKSKLKYSNNDLIWSSISNVGLTSKTYNCNISQDMLSTIYSKLKAGRPVIIGATTSSGSSQHWVVITGYNGSTSSFSTSGFTVNDPGTQNAATLSAFMANGSGTDRTKVIRIMY